VLIFMSTVSFANEQASIVVRGTGQVFQDNGVYYADIGGTHYRLDKRTNLLGQNPEYYYDDLVCNKFGHNWTKVYSGINVTCFGVSDLPASVYDFVLDEASPSKKDIAKLIERNMKDSKDGDNGGLLEGILIVFGCCVIIFLFFALLPWE
ncbi:MAG: hypothetical protein IJZ30_06910, partial [Alphaproteobacteria bacterium]|nr:hypothetical protein [Alphaproteobacteria bacterium]